LFEIGHSELMKMRATTFAFESSGDSDAPPPAPKIDSLKKAMTKTPAKILLLIAKVKREMLDCAMACGGKISNRR
jgi:hypothetical protein